MGEPTIFNPDSSEGHSCHHAAMLEELNSLRGEADGILDLIFAHPAVAEWERRAEAAEKVADEGDAYRAMARLGRTDPMPRPPEVAELLSALEPIEQAIRDIRAEARLKGLIL